MEYWKFKAIDRLRNHVAQKTAKVNLSEEIKRLSSEACSIKSATSDGTPVKGGGNGREDRLLSNIVQREEYGRMIERADISVRIVERALSVLDDEEQYMLQTMYIERIPNAVDHLAARYGLLEASSVYKRVNKALLNFTVAMYGITES